METFDTIFAAFSKFGNTLSDGTTINLSQSDAWMKQAGIFNNTFTKNDTAKVFNKLKNQHLDLSAYQEFLKLLCKEKNLELDQIKQKLVNAGLPKANITKYFSKTIAKMLLEVIEYDLNKYKVKNNVGQNPRTNHQKKLNISKNRR